MKYIFNITSLWVLITVFSSCKGTSDDGLKEGIWRATLKTGSGAEIPFNFEVTDSADQKFLDIVNGKERFRVNEISTISDSLIIQMPLFDSEIRAKFKNETLSGRWIKHYGDSDEVLQFDARQGDSWRFFKVNSESNTGISGRWSVTFNNIDKKSSYAAVGEFSQENGRVFGTFLTATGDYRFLEGTVSDNKLYLSCFDGSHAYLFTGKLMNDSTITDGKFYSGFSSIETWTANKDANAILPDAYSLTDLKDGYDKIDFSFPGLDGEKVSLSDEKFKNKIVLVQFFGSWCPNCMDETVYLTSFHKKYQKKGIEVVALAYERSKDFERSRKNISRLRDRFSVPYDMLITGFTNDKVEVSKSLPMLKEFIAFPTLMIIDKNGKIRKIHTGFSGPGTGSHYADFVKEFEKTIDDLLAEK
ncbi:Peroxiredoxin [Daejeonella rubra]|uniref:Peroxiredoxin n=1 Tax=Daejeonella rubra TaxID=990371 RepID=A0A1G9R2R0_9SPHI|nr:TlpA disulfide reductase family protein [Daejeonella rubra]SDM17592.1 Peroxiredoxin [Daejeonella rubra]